MNHDAHSAGDILHGFVVERVEEIPELRSQALVFSHARTGARLLHLVNEDPNNLFSIAFRTPVYDNTGVAHILEHSVLCGSRTFPVKDPFLELLKGSLQTFLNALTYPDKTVYPVSSQVEADFFNLVDVYCDAVLHPLLDEHTFFQEGWHFDCEQEGGAISIKGIVYNEMKGVFSDFSSHVSRRAMGALYPDTTYAFESGGDPDQIPELTYERFREFHRRYYHPSNAFIVLYGNIPSAKTLRFLDERYLASYDRITVGSAIRPQAHWSAPRAFRIQAPSRREDDGTATISVSWIIGDSTDPLSSFLARIVSQYLLGTESSPLKRALIDSGLGEDLSELSGLESDLVQSMFSAGLKKSRPGHARAVERIVLDTLRAQAAGGIDADLVEGALRRLEFRLREITSGGHFPYNLQLAGRCYRSWLYGGDPLALLKFEEPLERIKAEKRAGTAFFERFIRTRLIDNPHRLLSVVTASHAMAERLEGRTRDQARRLTAGFSDARKRECVRTTLALVREQAAPSPPEALATLPKLKKSELPPRNREVELTRSDLDGSLLYACPLHTAGVAYVDLGFDLRGVPRRLLRFLPLYAELISRCGAAASSYEEMAKRTTLAMGGFSTSLACERIVDRPGDRLLRCFFHGKVLVERLDEMLAIFADIYAAPHLDNTKQIKDILLEMRADFNASIVGAGHHFALRYAAARLSSTRRTEELFDGISQLRFLDNLVRTERFDEVAAAMGELHRTVISSRGCVVSITADDPGPAARGVETLLRGIPSSAAPVEEEPLRGPEPDGTVQGVEISSSVNYAARVRRLPSVRASDLGHAFLLARSLSTGYLWNKVRVEGGAYGGMALTSNAHGDFACASYRDPNLGATLAHFEAGLAAATERPAPGELDQSIIGAIGRIDAPKSPHEKGFGETLHLLCNRTREYRQEVRDAILGATPAGIARAAERLHGLPCSSTVVLGGATAFDEAEKQGLKIRREKLFP